MVIGDRGKVQQVLINLLSNAVKFTPPGGQIVVDFPVRADGSRAPKRSVRVRDTGPGIPRHRLRDIFEPFVQLSTGTAPAPGGIGLGLAISRDLARGMQGELRARSVEGEGAAFTLSLPMLPEERD